MPKNASQADIKKAYFQLAQKLHPDKNPAKDAKEKFAEVSGYYTRITVSILIFSLTKGPMRLSETKTKEEHMIR